MQSREVSEDGSEVEKEIQEVQCQGSVEKVYDID